MSYAVPALVGLTGAFLVDVAVGMVVYDNSPLSVVLLWGAAYGFLATVVLLTFRFRRLAVWLLSLEAILIAPFALAGLGGSTPGPVLALPFMVAATIIASTTGHHRARSSTVT